MALSIAAWLDLELFQLDVPQAFTQAPLDETVYMEMPPGFEQDGMVCRLLKSLYGLKQSPRNWYLLCSAFIRDELDFTATVSDPCFFHKRTRSGRLLLLFLFVDDMQVAVAKQDRPEWDELFAKLRARFNITDLGESKFHAGHAHHARPTRTHDSARSGAVHDEGAGKIRVSTDASPYRHTGSSREQRRGRRANVVLHRRECRADGPETLSGEGGNAAVCGDLDAARHCVLLRSARSPAQSESAVRTDAELRCSLAAAEQQTEALRAREIAEHSIARLGVAHRRRLHVLRQFVDGVSAAGSPFLNGDPVSWGQQEAEGRIAVDLRGGALRGGCSNQ